MKKIILIGCVFFSLLVPVNATELTGVYPVTDSIMLLTFDDGYVDIASETLWWGQHDVIHHDSLHREQAGLLSNYTITSVGDSNFKEGIQPVRIGIKSKMGDASWKGHTAILNHWIYLQLPHPLQRGNTYKVEVSHVDDDLKSDSLTFNDTTSFSETIHVNQVGFLPEANLKFGYLYQWMGTGGPLDLDGYAQTKFHLIDNSSGDIVYSGTITKRRDIETQANIVDTYSETDGPFYCGADVWQCDFSDFSEPGEYRLMVEKMGSSFPFKIAKDVYREPYFVTVRGLYHHRSGPERTMPYSKWYKGVDHMPGVNGFDVEYSEHRAMDKMNAFSELPAASTGNTMEEAWGGWFDAGDFDRQARHMIASNLLMFNYLLGPEKYADNQLNIPESGNGIPDILDEAAWGMDLFKRAKGPTGGIIGGLEANGHPHQRGSVADGSNLNWYAYAEEPKASYQYAATVIQLAACYEMAGLPEYIQELYTEAVNAFNWAQENLKDGDENKTRNERMRAAAWLYYFTADDVYQKIFMTEFSKGARDKEDYHMALFGYVMANHTNRNPSYFKLVKDEIISSANELLAAGKQRACRLASYDQDAFMRVGKATTPYIHDLIMAHQLSGHEEYLDYALTTCDYFLGGNPVNYVYVTGLGDRPVESVFNLDAFYDNQEEPIPGIVPYGHHTYGKWMEESKLTPHNHLFNLVHTYPDWREWPSHEFWFHNRFTIIHSEYTIRQNIGPAASAYSYFLDSITGVTPKKRVLISSPFHNENFLEGEEVEFSTDIQLPSDIEEVTYYLDGEGYTTVKEFPYTFRTDTLQPGSYELYMQVKDVNDSIYSTAAFPVSFMIEQVVSSGNFPDVKAGIRPNPSKGTFTITMGNQPMNADQVRIFDATGKEVFRKSLSGNALTTLEIEMDAQVAPGIYMVSLSNLKRRVTSRIIIN